MPPHLPRRAGRDPALAAVRRLARSPALAAAARASVSACAAYALASLARLEQPMWAPVSALIGAGSRSSARSATWRT